MKLDQDLLHSMAVLEGLSLPQWGTKLAGLSEASPSHGTNTGHNHEAIPGDSPRSPLQSHPHEEGTVQRGTQRGWIWDRYLTEAVLRDLHLEKLKSGHKSVMALCPFHRERSPSFHVFPTHSRKLPGYICFACGEKGTMLGLIHALANPIHIYESRLKPIQHEDGTTSIVRTGIPEAEWARFHRLHSMVTAVDWSVVGGEDLGVAQDTLQRLSYQPFSSEAHLRKATFQNDLAPKLNTPSSESRIRYEGERVSFANEDLNRFTPATDPELHPYVAERGITTQVADRYQLLVDAKERRIIIPVRDINGVLRGWSSRLFEHPTSCFRCNAYVAGAAKVCPKCHKLYAKYLHTPGMQKSMLLYGEDNYTTNTMPMIVEGFFDVLLPVSMGLTIATPMAVMGASTGWQQLRPTLEGLPSTMPVIACGDNDEAGQHLNSEIADIIQRCDPSRPVITIKLPPRVKDPGSLEKHQVADLQNQLESLRGDCPRRFTIQL